MDAKNLLQANENGSLYRGSGRSFQAAPGGFKAFMQNRKKGISAMLIILALMGGGVGFLGSSHTLLGPSLSAVGTEATNYQWPAFWQRVKNISKSVDNRLSGFVSKYSDIPADASANLAQGQAATFYDTNANRTYNHMGQTRNILQDFKDSNNLKTDTENLESTLEPRYDNNSTTVRSAHDEEKTVVDEDNNPVRNPDTNEIETEKVLVTETDVDGRSNASVAEAETKASNFIDSTASKVASFATQVGNAACTVMRIGATISGIVAANELYQAISFALNYMESISKMMYGEGSSSAYNAVMTEMVTQVDATQPNINTGEEQTMHGAMVEANGFQNVLAQAPLLGSTTSNFSIERTSSAVMGALLMSAEEVKVCAGVQAGAAVVSIITTIGSFGTSVIGQVLFNIAIGATISVTASIALNFLIPTVAKSLFTNFTERAKGIPGGEYLISGLSAANTRIGRSSSGMSLASKHVATAYIHTAQEVIAEQAEIDRQNRSPFDITSKNTFLGSIVYSLLPITLYSARSSTAVLTNINTLTRTTTSALSSLTGSAYAEKLNVYMANFGDCPVLDEIDAAGDIYCNPIVTIDPSLVDMSPDDTNYINIIKQNFIDPDCEDDCVIDPDKNLAKYITFCDDRDSPFGIVDANFLASLETGNVILGSVPILGDVIDVVNAARDAENIGWANGQKCVNSSENPDWDREFKYYQRYVEDQRILQWAGAYGDGKSPVLGYEEWYEAEHPLDNSYAGYIARISGVTKETAENVIALAEYYQYLDNYDAASAIAMSDLETQTVTEIAASAEHIHATPTNRWISDAEGMIATKAYIVYTDVRNRNHIV